VADKKLTKHLPTYEVDKQGLAKLLERRGKEFAVCELIQNSWDEDGTTAVEVELRLHEGRPGKPAVFPDGRPRYELEVRDDAPEGFADLAHAYTLFAESTKKNRADQRGRFNLGEKLVIAVCDYVQVKTTKGTVEFTDEGRREFDDTQPAGSTFTALLAMTEEEVKTTEAVIMTLLPPTSITTTFNGIKLTPREPSKTFDVTLRTELADDEGYLRPTRRKTSVGIHEPKPGETAYLYEMGIPVVETGDRWHVDIGQKVPLTTDRDNVPPGYLRDVRTAVLNACADMLDADSADAKWINDALEDEAVDDDAVKAVIKGRYGDKVVIDDKSDAEGTKIAVTKGYTVIPGGAFSKDAWKAVKGAGAAKPAGQVTPSPKPHAGEAGLDLMLPEHYPEGVAATVAYARWMAQTLLAVDDITIRVANAIKWPYAATYGPKGNRSGQLTLNYGRLGHGFFVGRSQSIDELLLHEFSHHRVSDHLSHDFADEIGRLGALLVQAALDDPDAIQAFDPADALAAR